MEYVKRTHNHLDADGKNAVLIFLFENCVGKGVLARGAIKAASIKFAVSDDTVSRIWKLRDKINLEDPSSIRRVLGNKKKGRVGTKRAKLTRQKFDLSLTNKGKQ